MVGIGGSGQLAQLVEPLPELDQAGRRLPVCQAALPGQFRPLLLGVNVEGLRVRDRLGQLGARPPVKFGLESPVQFPPDPLFVRPLVVRLQSCVGVRNRESSDFFSIGGRVAGRVRQDNTN